MDHGSLDARRELLTESIRVTMHHPLFGVGPGNFQAYTQSWHVTHNTYTELSSETGLPGLGLFLAILLLTFRSLKQVSETQGTRRSANSIVYERVAGRAGGVYRGRGICFHFLYPVPILYGGVRCRVV